MSNNIFSNFREIKKKDYQYCLFSSKPKTYYRHKYYNKDKVFYGEIRMCGLYPTAYISFNKKYLPKNYFDKKEKDYDFFNEYNFSQGFTYYKELKNKIILGWDYCHAYDYSIYNLNGKKHNIDSVIIDLEKIIREMTKFLNNLIQKN